jgi:hypothetical protein
MSRAKKNVVSELIEDLRAIDSTPEIVAETSGELLSFLKSVEAPKTEVLVPEVTIVNEVNDSNVLMSEVNEVNDSNVLMSEVNEVNDSNVLMSEEPEVGEVGEVNAPVAKENDMLSNTAIEVAKLAVVKRRCVSTVAKLLILEGYDNTTVFEKLDAEFAIGEAKRSYPSWYRNDLIKKGLIGRSEKEAKAKKVKIVPVPTTGTVVYSDVVVEETTY